MLRKPIFAISTRTWGGGSDFQDQLLEVTPVQEKANRVTKSLSFV